MKHEGQKLRISQKYHCLFRTAKSNELIFFLLSYLNKSDTYLKYIKEYTGAWLHIFLDNLPKQSVCSVFWNNVS